MGDTQLTSFKKALESAFLQIAEFKTALDNDKAIDAKTKDAVSGLLNELQSKCQLAKESASYSATKHPFLRRKSQSSGTNKHSFDASRHAPLRGKRQTLEALHELLQKLGNDPMLTRALGAILAPLFWHIMYQLHTQLITTLESPNANPKRYTIGRVEKTSFEFLDPHA